MTLAGQSFFDPLPAGADLYLLKSVLNDWPDEPTVAILRRCAEAAHEKTSIAILGGVAPDEAPRELGIDMLVAGGTPARSRSSPTWHGEAWISPPPVPRPAAASSSNAGGRTP